MTKHAAHDLGGVWRMVRRTAFAQLRYSYAATALTVAALAALAFALTGAAQAAPAQDLERHGHRKVPSRRSAEGRKRHAQCLGPHARPDEHHRRQGETEEEQVAHPLAEGGVVGRFDPQAHSSSSSWKLNRTSCWVRGAARSFGSRASTWPCPTRNPNSF